MLLRWRYAAHPAPTIQEVHTVNQAQAPAEAASPLMTPAEVADALRIDTDSLARWARDGRIASITLPNGHRRYRKTVVEAILAGAAPSAT